jgi:hypothetical protein
MKLMDQATRSPSSTEALLGGGTDGNEILTSTTGAVLFVLLAAIGITIVRIGQLTWLHLFVGLLLIGPVALKLASTGYRFTRYYTGAPTYVEAGPPWMPLRLMAPIVAVSTVTVFLTGVILLFGGPADRQPWLMLHKVSFIVWVVFTVLHVAGHLPEMGRLLGIRHELVSLPGIRTDLETGAHDGPYSTGVTRGPGSTGRWLALGASVAAGLVLALVLISDFGAWTGAAAHFHHG